jgi:signal transduction histidine kinase
LSIIESTNKNVGVLLKEDISINDLIDRDLLEFQQFSTMLSKTVHDINNPLAVLVGQLSIVDILKEKGKLTPEKMDLILSKLKSSSETFIERLNHLREFYKIPLNDESFQNLDQVIKSTIYYLDKTAYNHDINLISNVPEDINLNIPSDKLFLVLKILITNSIEAIVAASKSGGDINISVVEEANSIRLDIEDSGPGLVCDISIAMGTGYTTKGHTHKGYGLAVVSKILDEHQISISYAKTKKTTFSLICSKK